MPKFLDAPKGSGRKDIKNSFMFNPKGVGAGTWAGDGAVTRTRATSTLFVTFWMDIVFQKFSMKLQKFLIFKSVKSKIRH